MQNGQPVQLLGYDVGVSTPPIYNQAADLNANFVRITAPWSEVEPTKPTGKPGNMTHHWNETELAALDRQVKDLGAQGIQVLIDFHQFHWSPYYAQLECKAGAEDLPCDRRPGLVLRRPLRADQARRVGRQGRLLGRRPADLALLLLRRSPR